MCRTIASLPEERTTSINTVNTVVCACMCVCVCVCVSVSTNHGNDQLWFVQTLSDEREQNQMHEPNCLSPSSLLMTENQSSTLHLGGVVVVGVAFLHNTGDELQTGTGHE